MTKDDKRKTHLEKCYKIYQRLLDLLGKARAPKTNTKMSSRGIYYIDRGSLGFMMHMHKIKEKETPNERPKVTTCVILWETNYPLHIFYGFLFYFSFLPFWEIDHSHAKEDCVIPNHKGLRNSLTQ